MSNGVGAAGGAGAGGGIACNCTSRRFMASSIWPRSLASAAPLEAITAQATAMAVELFLKPINSRFIFISIQEN
ncbi:MAG: hypothetical protein RR928_04905 [Comamonas sp.]